jgi:Protein of unknown function (DUF3800)
LYVLYLDESGNPDNPADRHFVLGGAAVFEQTTFFLSRDFDNLQRKHWPTSQPIEFHASPIRSGKGFWRSVPAAERETVLDELGLVIKNSNKNGVVLFAAVVEKDAKVYGEDAVKLATEQVVKRFDTFLTRCYQEQNNPQRGLLVFADSHYQKRAKLWVHGFRNLGTQWGVLNNLADMPYFAAARENRLLQAADYVAHAAFSLYEKRDPKLMQHIVSRFDQKGGVFHGFVHVMPTHGSPCECPAHVCRRTPGNLGTWLQS